MLMKLYGSPEVRAMSAATHPLSHRCALRVITGQTQTARSIDVVRGKPESDNEDGDAPLHEVDQRI